MMLGVIASDGKVMPPLWIDKGIKVDSRVLKRPMEIAQLSLCKTALHPMCQKILFYGWTQTGPLACGHYSPDLNV